LKLLKLEHGLRNVLGLHDEHRYYYSLVENNAFCYLYHAHDNATAYG